MNQEFRKSPKFISRYLHERARNSIALLGVGLVGIALRGEPYMAENFIFARDGILYFFLFFIIVGTTYLPYTIRRFRTERLVADASGLKWMFPVQQWELALGWTNMTGVRATRLRSGRITKLRITGLGMVPMRLSHLDDPERLLQIAQEQTGIDPEYATAIDWSFWRSICFYVAIVGMLNQPITYFTGRLLAFI